MTETGPPYPPAPAGGSNAIGSFQIGVSPIGTISPFLYWKTIISQYANGEALPGIIGGFAEAIDQTKNFDDFYDFIWNVDTAQGHGLDVWGRIVNISRTLQVPVGSSFGFIEASGDGIDTFGAAAFYTGQALTQNYNLTDEPYRLLIMAKAASNITDCSIPAINAILMGLFPNRGNCYVAEGYPFLDFYFGFKEAVDTQPFNQAPFYSGNAHPIMSLTYVFEFGLTAVELAIVTQSGAIPKPTGVFANVLQLA